MSFKGFMWLTVATALALAVLVGLGTWQLQRLDWKEGLIARIEARATADPVPLEAALRLHRETGDVEYLRLALTGRFDHGAEAHHYTVIDGRAGWRVVTPLETADGVAVMVDRGFVPEPLKEPATRPAGQIDGQVALVGLARIPESQALFVPDNDPAANAWFWRDLEGMARAAGRAPGAELAPFFVEAEATPVPGGYPRGGVTRLVLPNRHREYALTWYGLAGTLLAVYAVLALNLFRNRKTAA